MGVLRPGWKIGCYELIRLLGEGGMGEVWLAHDDPADRQVALKFIKPHLLNNPGMRVRFTNEARTLGKLEQDRIVTLYTVVEEGEHLAFVLRYIEGQSLADRIDTQFPLSMNFVLSSARDVLAALGEAHQRGIIHRDIKPQNILIDRKDRSFLTDFGIAVSDFQERATVGVASIGTPHYMSPEQITRPRDLTVASGGLRTDIYSYGIVLYEMLTGRVPFGQDSAPDEIFTVQQAHCQEAPPMLRSFNGSVSPAMEAVVLRCLEKDPNARPQNCAELLEEIEAAARGTVSHRTATVMESSAESNAVSHTAGPSRRQTVAASSIPTTVPPPPATQSSFLQRKLAMGGAGLVLLAGLGFAVYSFSGKHNSEPASPATETPPAKTTAPIEAAAPSHRQPVKGAAYPQNQAATRRTIPPPQGVTVAGQLPAAAAPANTVPTPGPTDDMKQAAALAATADRQYKAGEYCEALASLDQAIGLNRDPKYVSRRPTYEHGCNMQ